MRNHFQGFGILLLATCAFCIPACSDDGNQTSTSSGTTSSSGSGSSSSSSGAGGAGGEGPGVNPLPGTEIVSGGDVVKSNKFKMVVTFGPSTPAVGTMQSPKHKVHNGLVGITEGTK
jgi:hypothetical protein